MTAKPLLLNHPNSLDTPPWMILDGGYEDPWAGWFKFGGEVH
jgi:hypothetical protein